MFFLEWLYCLDQLCKANWVTSGTVILMVFLQRWLMAFIANLDDFITSAAVATFYFANGRDQDTALRPADVSLSLIHI